MTLDYKISKTLNTHNIAAVSIYNFISIYSSIIVGLLIVIFFDKTPSKIYIKAIILLMIIILVFKHFTKRKRPYIKHKDIYNRDLIETTKNGSFPSMHTMSATIMSFMIYREYNIKFIFPVWPILTMISRIGLGVHYLSDCVLTFVISLAINFIFYL